jgi:hypothetical protein
VLAAIGFGVSILVVVNAPALAIAGLAVESDRRSPEQLRRYTLLVGLAGTVVLLALAVPPGSTGNPSTVSAGSTSRWVQLVGRCFEVVGVDDKALRKVKLAYAGACRR